MFLTHSACVVEKNKSSLTRCEEFFFFLQEIEYNTNEQQCHQNESKQTKKIRESESKCEKQVASENESESVLRVSLQKILLEEEKGCVIRNLKDAERPEHAAS